MAISISGLASGLDVESIVANLMKIERAPRARLEVRQGQAKARQDALREIKTKLQAVADAAAALRSPGLWADTQAVKSSAPDSIAVKRLAGAGPGGYTVEVTQLARAEQRTFDFTASESPTALTINGATIALGAGATLTDAVAAINAKPESGVYAVDVGGRLVLASRQTGAAATIAASGEAIAEDASKLKAGLDASFSVDGVAMSSASNVVGDAIPGLELTLTAVTSGPATISVGNPGADAEAIKSAVKTFVSSYNAALDAVRAKLGEERVAKPATQAEANRGVLFADTQLSGLLAGMRQLVSESGLAALGVSTGAPGAAAGAGSPAVTGRLSFDEAKLTAAVAADADAVRKLWSGAGGFAEALEGLLKPTIGSGGAIAGRLDSIAAESKRLGEAMTRLDARLEKREERLHSQFASLESLLMKQQSQSAWLNGQLASFYQ